MSDITGQSPASSFTRWWVPSIGTFIWLAFFLATVFTDLRGLLIGADGDPCLHWRIGNWMIEHRTIIQADQFSHTRLHAPLVSKEWLSEILFAAAGNRLGWNGFILIAGLLIATCVWLLHRHLLAEGNELLLSTGLVGVAALACGIHWLARPHLFTHLFTVVFAWQLRSYDRGHLPFRQLFARLIPLMILWVNLHGAFVTGGILVGIYLLGNMIVFALSSTTDKPAVLRKVSHLGILLFACGVASCINPNGWRLPWQVVRFLSSPVIVDFTREFASPNFQSGEIWGFLLQLLLLGIMFLKVRPRCSPAEILLIIVWGYFALVSVRNVPVFALVITPILAGHFNNYLRGVEATGLVKRYRRISANVTGLDQMAGGRALIVLTVAGVILLFAKSHLMGGRPIIRTDLPEHRFPVEAVEFLRRSPQAVAGEMFNDYVWGGYLMLVLPERKVFVDGRADFYGEELMRDFITVDNLRPGWEKVLDKYNVGWVIEPPDRPLCNLLALHPQWRLVYSNTVSLIYARRRPSQ